MQPEFPRYAKEVQEILAQLANDQNNRDQEPKTEKPDTQSQAPLREIHVIFVREEEEDEQSYVDSTAHIEDLDTTPLQPQPTSNAATGIVPFGVFIILLCLISLAVQFNFIVNPFTVNVTLLAKSQQIALTGTLQLGSMVNPITVSQSQTVPTTGHAHQDARAATGSITFYNGQLQSVFIPAGTTVTGNSGVAIITDQDANIPAANLPQVGQATVSAHAVDTGSSGNIAAYDITQGCCATAVKAVNTTSFSGGQDERDYRTVTKTDITNAAAPLKATVMQGSTASLQGQLKTNEALTTPSCTTTTTSSNQPGEEATQVKGTVSDTCSAVAYNQDTLQAKVTDLLNHQAAKKLATGYSLLGDPQVTVTQAATQQQKVVLSFNAQSTWIYALSTQEQQHMKQVIAGKYTLKAKQLLSGLPGIESVSMQSSGFGDDTRMPKDISNIHLLIIYTAA